MISSDPRLGGFSQSVVRDFSDTEEATGSSPVGPTIKPWLLLSSLGFLPAPSGLAGPREGIDIDVDVGWGGDLAQHRLSGSIES